MTDVNSTPTNQHIALIAAAELERERINPMLERFHANKHDPEVCYAFVTEAIALVDRLEQAGDWDASPYLTHLIAPFRQMRDQGKRQCEVAQCQQKVVEHDLLACREDEDIYYILLYQSHGHDLQEWHRFICSLPQQMAGRSIYKTEQQVMQAIVGKKKRELAAYVAVVVPKRHALTSGFFGERKDTWGQDLVELTDGCLHFEDIKVFVHEGKRYRFHGKSLDLLLDDNAG